MKLKKRSFFYDSQIGVVSRERRIHTDLPFDSTVMKVSVVLKKMRARIIRTANDSGSIFAYKGWSILSDGEVLTISISQSDIVQGCDVVVHSESAFPKIWDFGVINRNLNRFEKLLHVIKPG